jgi:hypothetical protein
MPSDLEKLARQAAVLEKEEPLDQKATLFFRRGRRESSGLRTWLRNHVTTYALGRDVFNRIAATPASRSRSFEAAVAGLTPMDRLHVSVVDGPDWRTILTAPYRHLVLDRRDPRVLLGFELVVGALRSIADGCRAAGVDTLFVLIPTKESVFWPRVSKPEAHGQLRQLVSDEDALRAELVRRLTDAGLEVTDLLSALRTSASQPYFENSDGHPSPAGHVIIANRVAGWVIEHAAPTPGRGVGDRG